LSRGVVLKRASQRIPDEGHLPAPLTWDVAVKGPPGTFFDDDIALITCDHQHTLRMSGRIHSVAEDGTVTPSWVCRYYGCTFHEHLRLEGWETRDKRLEETATNGRTSER
jgi:hypothetical protein